MSEVEQFCFCWLAGASGEDATQKRAAMVKASQWKSKEKITVGFLDGDTGVQGKVREAALGWKNHMGVVLDFRKDANTLVRISFKHKGSWSTLGTTCRQVPKGQATMNYGWLTPTSTPTEVERVVLHEFGHALGLVHEHQNPAGGIKWNKPQIYKDLSGPPNSWTKEQIDHNMFKAYAASETNFTATDGKSIMMYPIPKSWTTDGFTVGLNNTLSATDKKFIRKMYP
jgi:astacin (peptidase family M12A)